MTFFRGEDSSGNDRSWGRGIVASATHFSGLRRNDVGGIRSEIDCFWGFLTFFSSKYSTCQITELWGIIFWVSTTFNLCDTFKGKVLILYLKEIFSEACANLSLSKMPGYVCAFALGQEECQCSGNQVPALIPCRDPCHSVNQGPENLQES